MLKRLLFFSLLLLSFCTTGIYAQNPCDPIVVNQVKQDLIAQGSACLENAGPFACVNDVFEYAFENCPPGLDTTWGDPCDPIIVNQTIADLIAQGSTCLQNAGPFACVDEVFEYAFENCPPNDTLWHDPCDSASVGQLTTDLIAQGFTCLQNAGPFACVSDVLEYAFENCPPNDTLGHDPCDSLVVQQLIADMIGCGFECLENAGPFACVDDVLEYAFENCPPNDTLWHNPCDSASVSQVIANLIAQGSTCLQNAGPFACVDDVLEYAFTNCPPKDTTWGDPCDSVLVGQVIAELIAQGVECLENAGPFACLDDVFEFVEENCPPIDTTWGDPCDSASVAQAINDLIAQGYTCLNNAGPFACVHDAVCYAFENCPLPTDTLVFELPECLENIPPSVQTFQQFIHYVADNCDSTFAADIPACWLAAPPLASDEEFFAWIMENCTPWDSLITKNDDAFMRSYFSGTVLSAKNINKLDGVSLSPNPTLGQLDIRLTDGQIGSIEVMDITGRKLITKESVNNRETELDLSKLTPGVYMVRIIDLKQRVATQRVVKQ
jgi:hypothetical protein